MSNAIEFDHVSKQYRLGLVSTKTLSHDIHRWWVTSVLGKEDPYLKIGETNDRASKGNSEYVWALRDITFNVEQGDVVGIIGKNGAGKSTLLKLLSRVTGPTTGQIRAHGRIGSLLEVGTGFHGEMTGRENIFMNGAILGMTKSEIQRKLDEIIDFSGCERYIDTPVKRYSSGMTVRLGFAVAAFLEPEILVVDEVLAVGDAEFQKKAIGKMQDVASDGRTVLFVSHNMDSIRNLCKNGVVLKNGMVDYMGTAIDSVNYYLQRNMVDCVTHVDVDGIKYRHNQTESIKRKMEFVSFDILNNPEEIASDEPLLFDAIIKRNRMETSDFQCAVILSDLFDKRFATYVTPMMQVSLGNNLFKVRLELHDHHLAKGDYKVQFDLGIKDYANAVENYDGVSDAFLIKVNLLHKEPLTAFAGWDASYGYYLNQQHLFAQICE